MNLATAARLYYQACENHDRRFVENGLADGFSFTSPYDEHIGRDAYFERCWPNNRNIARFTFVAVMEQGNSVFVVYECATTAGLTFRNAEYLTFENGKLKSVEVFFGDPPTGIDRDDYAVFVDVGKQAWDQRLHSF